MVGYAIENLQDVLRSERFKNHMKITNTKITALTQPGENYGSIMLKLDITFKNEKDGIEEQIHAVAKQIPEQEFIRQIFNIQVTFKNEIAMYDTVVPTLQQFQRENGVTQVIHCFPELYGARINLGDENGIVDENAILILENLDSKGYRVINRHIGFDLKTAQLILKDLAAFHAIPLALKLRKPEVFEKKIRPCLAPFRPPSLRHKEDMDAVFIEILQDSCECIPWIPKIKDILQNQKAARAIPPREPFSTMTHGDMWVNNTMVKFENGLPIDNKLLDFQVCDYKSPAVDVFFFLFSSVQLSVLQNSLDDLIEIYHKHFISHLKQLKCDVTPFSFPKFLEEMKAATLTEIPHSIMMLIFIIFGKKGGSAKPFDPNIPPDTKKIIEDMSLEAKGKVRFVVQACGKRGWL